MITNIDAIIDFTLEWEGGAYENVPGDSGGPTKWGITQNYDAQYLHEGETIKELTKARAVEIYKTKYWKAYMDGILDAKIAARLFDLSVNMGHKRANVLLQKALQKAGMDTRAEGNITPEQIQFINNTTDKDALYKSFQMEAELFYRYLADHRDKAKFLKGWLNRLYDDILKYERKAV